MEEFDFNSFKTSALDQIKNRASLFGKEGVFAPLLEKILTTTLQGEMDAHLSEIQRQIGNQRNGKMDKQVQTPLGEVAISTPPDRNASFSPQFIKKRDHVSRGVADHIIGLYALGISTRGISTWMEENLVTRLSADTINSITDRILPGLKVWRTHPLNAIRLNVWMEAIQDKVMADNNQVVSRVVYNVLTIDRVGRKDLLGMYVAKSEGADFWLSVLSDFQNRGIKDILIACVDG